MNEISIEIVSNYDPRIINLLESIREQNFQEYETVVATDCQNLIDLIKDYDVKVVQTMSSGTLYRRMEAHKRSKSRKSLLLEASRFLHRNCLLELSQNNHDMIVVEEKDVGNGLIARLQNVERSVSVHKTVKFSPKSLIVEPRVFSKPILDKAFLEIGDIPESILLKIQYGDLDIIYHESFKVSQDVSRSDFPLIYHHTDENIFELIKKYYNYGKSNRFIKMTKYSENFTLKNHFRPYYGIKESFQLYPLWLTKALSFGLGQYNPFSLRHNKKQLEFK